MAKKNKREQERERLRKIGSDGGKANFKKHGKKHMQKISRMAVEKRGWKSSAKNVKK